MEIDFHFGVTYVVARVAGFKHEEAEIIATSSQYVDDTKNEGTLEFNTGEAYYRMITAHDMSDYHIALSSEERLTWVPFHFLPGNNSQGPGENPYFNKLICRPNSSVAQEMIKNCILKKDRKFSLHQLGITAHVYVDTWAHQGFAGISHKVNGVKDIQLLEPADDSRGRVFWELIWREGLSATAAHYIMKFTSFLFDEWFPMGHGAALHFPDHPFRRWSYKNGHGELIERDNHQIFVDAAENLCVFFQRYLSEDPGASVKGFSTSERTLISKYLLEFKNEDPRVRLGQWIQLVRENQFGFGAQEIFYASHGENSWKFAAYGSVKEKVGWCEKFDYKDSFLDSNWKLFHDAAKAHQIEVIHEIFPKFGICAI